MIDPDAVLGVLQALAEDAHYRHETLDVEAYRDRIVALAEDVGICGHTPPWYRGVQCDLSAGHRGLHSGLSWDGPPDTLVAARRAHWSDDGAIS